jgi:hypothetical protein
MSLRIEIADLSLVVMRSSPISVSSTDESDSESAPYTTSPLDNCRGAGPATVKYRSRKVRDASSKHAQAKKVTVAK